MFTCSRFLILGRAAPPEVFFFKELKDFGVPQSDEKCPLRGYYKASSKGNVAVGVFFEPLGSLDCPLGGQGGVHYFNLNRKPTGQSDP